MKAEIENNEHRPYNNELETLYDYNHRLIDSISDADIKTELIANGNCTPNMKDADYLHSHEKKDAVPKIQYHHSNNKNNPNHF